MTTRTDVLRLLEQRAHTFTRESALRGLLLSGLDLSGIDFRGADLRDCHFVDVDLRGSDLTECNCSDTRFQRVDLTGVVLEYTWLHSAHLEDVVGMEVVVGVGSLHRTIFAVDHGDVCMVQAGCRWEPLDDVRLAVVHKYHSVEEGYRSYMRALDHFQAWHQKLHAARLAGGLPGA